MRNPRLIPTMDLLEARLAELKRSYDASLESWRALNEKYLAAAAMDAKGPMTHHYKAQLDQAACDVQQVEDEWVAVKGEVKRRTLKAKRAAAAEPPNGSGRPG